MGQFPARLVPGVSPQVALAALVVMGVGCSLRFEESAETWPLEGQAVDVQSLPHIAAYSDGENIGFELPRIMPGADGAPWFVFGDKRNGVSTRIHLVRLQGEQREELVEIPMPDHMEAAPIRVGEGALYSWWPSFQMRTHQVGGSTSDPFAVDFDELGLLWLAVNHSDTTIGWIKAGGGDVSYLRVMNNDGSGERVLPIPNRLCPQALRISDAGEVAMVHHERWTLIDLSAGARAEGEEDPCVRGPEPPDSPFVVRFLPSLRAMARADWRGLRVLRFDGRPPQILDPEGRSFAFLVDATPPQREATDRYCDFVRWPVPVSSPSGFCRYPWPPDQGDYNAQRIYYFAQAADGSMSLRSLPLDGSGPPIVEASLAAGPPLDLHLPHVATLDLARPHDYSHAFGASVDGIPVMERGRMLRFSSDGTRVRFIEHDANVSAAGDLLSGPLAGPWERVARNVRAWDELPDGRLIAVANYPFAGRHNRVVLIDEARRVATRLVESAARYFVVPGGAEALVMLQDDAPDVETIIQGDLRDLIGPVVRVPIPPR